ncbi:MAG: competence/damage-inducible protein A [Lachnospiraceae bacterium]
MIVELISVGTEILLGNIVNTNAAYLSKKCADLGLSLYYQTVVGDNDARLTNVTKTALERSDVLIYTGGLGPTKDDLTKEVVAQVFNLPLVEDAAWRVKLEEFLEIFVKNHPGRVATSNNWKQALIIEGAKVLPNSNGTAPGLLLEKDGKTVILLPGPPNELKPMFKEQVFPYLRSLQPEIIYSQMIKICGIGESQVESEISDLIEAQSNPTIAPYAKTGEVHLRVTAKAQSEAEAKELNKPMLTELKKRFGRNIFTSDEDETLSDVIITLMKNLKMTLSLAESCTGGWLASKMVSHAGASEVFKEGFVTYSNKAKRRTIAVHKETLKKYGAVSAQTAIEMARGGNRQAHTDVCVSITGIAGPGGGSPAKPVGTVFIACAIHDKVKVSEFHFTGEREKIREQAAVAALTLLRSCLLKAKR